MKKLLTLAAVMLASATMAHAQIGIVGGFTSSKSSIDTKNVSANFQNVSLYHIGVAYQLDLPMGFAVQPKLTYQMKGAKLSDIEGVNLSSANLESKTGYIELGAGLQYGIDLLVARPFLVVEPFIGYQVTGSESISQLAEAKKKLEYGFALGAGVEVLEHVQLTIQWFKNLGNVYDADNNVIAALPGIKDMTGYNGVKVTLGLFF